MSRRRNPRVEMREKMMEAKRWLNHMTSVWRPTSWTYDLIEMPGGRKSHRRRPLRPDERVENRPDELRELITYMQAARVRCGEVEAIARQRLQELEAERDG